jgi:hypothetical protein
MASCVQPWAVTCCSEACRSLVRADKVVDSGLQILFLLVAHRATCGQTVNLQAIKGHLSVYIVFCMGFVGCDENAQVVKLRLRWVLHNRTILSFH